MVRWVDGMAYDDEGAVQFPPPPTKQEVRLEYLEEFWHLKTNEMKIADLREINEEIITRTGYPTPEEYSI